MTAPASLLLIAAKGRWGTVALAIRRSGEVPAKVFFDALEETAKASFLADFQSMANSGEMLRNRFKKEMDKLYTFKREIKNRQIRFPCFQDGNCWIVTHGFFKPGAQKGKGRWPKAEIDRASIIQHEYQARKQSIDSTKARK